ncbi:MAG: hypothetical protein H6585_12195 [Flavobacteriales bacterium]|nr:hypothetical protein [Flavobacteriales bacterium]MCB9449091.1 hypothetical protein [Flavobacteriales bacterium]
MFAQAITVEKEHLGGMRFKKSEVLNDKEEITTRKKLLEIATSLGNVYRRKVKILFEVEEGLKRVETTIWATTEGNIILKGGRIIPIHCIRQVSIF